MTLRGALALALILAAPTSGAVSLGEVEVRSYLGDKLDARIAVSPAAGESIRGACFSLARDAALGVPRLTAGELLLQRSASGTYLRIRSADPIADPALALGIVIACPGQEPQGTKEFSVLVDPRTRSAAPRVDASRPVPPASTQLGARAGDTLESIATAIFPRDRTARGSYLAALRETNPSLAARGDREPIPANEFVALPDLRTFMQRRRTPVGSSAAATGALPSASAELATAARPEPRARPPRAPSASRAAPAPLDATRERPAAPAQAAPAPAISQPQRTTPPPAVAAARARAPSPGFRLKLSASEVDLTRSNTIDDRSRAQLRERLLMLDADDQVAAMLSMRNSLRQLEARVAELQLKLAGMPPSLAPKAESTAELKAPQKVEAAATSKEIATLPAVVPTPAPTTIAKVDPPAPAPTAQAQPPAPATSAKVEPALPAPAAATASSPEPATLAPAPQEPRAPRAYAKPAPAPATTSGLPSWLWAVVALLAVLALLLVWLMRRRRSSGEEGIYPQADALIAPEELVDEIAPESVRAPAEEDEAAFASRAQERRVVASDAELTTRIPEENAADLRRRYMEERFPEIVTRMISLENPDSVVKGARLFYEDGALPRAVELLQFAIEAHPEEVKSWLALFEIFRLERLSGEFAALARRFKQQHGESEHWRKVQYFGREIDPVNGLYEEEPLNTLETIGPREARRLAAASSFDPVAENWLNAPMDFENEVLANELRMVLMQLEGLTEQDLVPDPMPALRNVEMFTVA
jgi:hypothetical protein